MKKVLQLRADQKVSQIIHIDYFGNRASQSIRDGHREKHEVQEVVLTDCRPSNATDVAIAFHLSSFFASASFLFSNRSVAEQASYTSHQSDMPIPFPAYLFIHRLEV